MMSAQQSTHIWARFILRYSGLSAGSPHTVVGALQSGAFADRLRRSTIIFDDRAHENELQSLEALGRQWKFSLAFLAIAVAGLTICSLFMLHYSGKAVNGILEVGRKADRYRRGEPLGGASSRRDEIGIVDRALHEFGAELQQRERLLKRYRLLAEVTHDIILFVDRSDLIIIDANAAAEAAYGYPDLIGKPNSPFSTRPTTRSTTIWSP